MNFVSGYEQPSDVATYNTRFDSDYHKNAPIRLFPFFRNYCPPFRHLGANDMAANARRSYPLNCRHCDETHRLRARKTLHHHSLVSTRHTRT